VSDRSGTLWKGPVSTRRKRLVLRWLAVGAVASAVALLVGGYALFGGHGSTRAREHAVAASQGVHAAAPGSGLARGGLPADELPTTFLARATAILHLVPETVKTIGTFTDADGRTHTLYVGSTDDGKSCLLHDVTGGPSTAGTPAGPQGGGCRPGSVAGQPLRWSASYAGSPSANEGLVLVGVAAPGVDHIRVVGADGASRAARLGASHGFFFESSDGTFEPKEVIAYGRDGRALARMSLAG
jgi:hypothetical protein